MPSINFYTEVNRIIMDVLRQNSKTLEFYNETANKSFAFVQKYRCKREYLRVSETLHSHFNQIIKQSKHPELLSQNKIPFPIVLDDENCLIKILELRYTQLRVALQMKQWSDAYQTSNNIYQLINK
jgi:hypothetical protein